MKIFIALLLLLGTFNKGYSQDSWKIIHNGVPLLQSKVEDAEKNTIAIRIPALSKTGFLSVVYSEKPKQKDWKRTIMIVDDDDSELWRKEGSAVKIENIVLRSYFKKSSILKVYTMALPSDPEKAALVRVRRVHLATITSKR